MSHIQLSKCLKTSSKPIDFYIAGSSILSLGLVTVGDTFHAFTSRIERGMSMSKVDEREYWVPEHVRDYLRSMGFTLPLEAMEGFIREWHTWLSATGDFYNYRDTDGFGRIYEVHRRSIHPDYARLNIAVDVVAAFRQVVPEAVDDLVAGANELVVNGDCFVRHGGAPN